MCAVLDELEELKRRVKRRKGVVELGCGRGEAEEAEVVRG